MSKRGILFLPRFSAVLACCVCVHVGIAFSENGESVHTHTVIHSRRGVKHGCVFL